MSIHIDNVSVQICLNKKKKTTKIITGIKWNQFCNFDLQIVPYCGIKGLKLKETSLFTQNITRLFPTLHCKHWIWCLFTYAFISLSFSVYFERRQHRCVHNVYEYTRVAIIIIITHRGVVDVLLYHTVVSIHCQNDLYTTTLSTRHRRT